MADRPIRLVIVDDHPAIALALEAAIARETADGTRSPIEIAWVARTSADAIEHLRRERGDVVDVALCDIQLGGRMDGLAVVDAARAAGCRAIVLTSFDRSSFMRAAFERGASGFLNKAVELGEILRAVRTVAAGGTAFSAASLDAARFAPRPPSEREVAVLRELPRGATSEEIGGRLGISPRTVESHLRRLFDRYGVVSRTELTVLALQEGWIEAGAG